MRSGEIRNMIVSVVKYSTVHHVPAVEGIDKVHTAQSTIDALQAVEQILDARMMCVQLNLSIIIEKRNNAFSEKKKGGRNDPRQRQCSEGGSVKET